MKRTPHPGGPGRPRVEIDWHQLGVYVERGASLEDCAYWLGVSLATVKRRLREDPAGRLVLRQRRFEFKDKCRRIMLVRATSGNSMALKYVAENVLGWRIARLFSLQPSPDGAPFRAELSVRSVADLAALALGRAPVPDAEPADDGENTDPFDF